MTPQHIALCVAFWVAVLLFRRSDPSRGEAFRFIAGMAIGAAFTHLGWALFYIDRVAEHPMALLNPAAGYSVLFFPLGFLATAPWTSDRNARDHYLAASLGALPLAIAAARVGCLLGGCCGGSACALPGFDHYPTQWMEVIGFVALHIAVSRAPTSSAPAIMLAGFGLARLVVQPLRAIPEAGPEVFSPMIIAGAWFVAGCVWLWQGRQVGAQTA